MAAKKCHCRSGPTFGILTKLQSLKLINRLRSNGRPSAAESLELSQLISAADAEDFAYKMEISRLHTVIAALEYDRGRLKSQVELSRSFLSPIRRVPAEVLVEIFSHFCDKSTVQDKVRIPAMILARVCKHWRTLAMSSKSLWTSISILVTSEPHLQDMHELVINFLTKKSDPFSLNIEIISERSRPTERHPALDSLFRSSPRWQSLSLHFHEYLPFFDDLQGTLDRLEHVRLRCRNFPKVEFPRFFVNAPRLHIFDFGGPGIHSFATNFLGPLPLQKVVYVGRTSVLTLMREASHLQHLKLKSRSGLYRFDAQSIVTSHIVSFEYRMRDDFSFRNLSSLFAHLVLPSLTSLSLLGHVDMTLPMDFSGLIEQLRTLLERSSCTLRILRLIHVDMPTPILLDLLSLIPSLEQLTVHEVEYEADDSDDSDDEEEVKIGVINDSFLHRLHRCREPFSLGSQPILPHLTHLDFEIISGPNFTDKLFADMVRARWNSARAVSAEGVACLRYVKLNIFSREFDPELWESIHYLRLAGLDISVEDNDGCIFAQILAQL